MDAYNLAGYILLAACLALVVFVAAAEAGLVSISRGRVRLLQGQGVPRADILHSYIQERGSLLQALALARILALVASTTLAYSVLAREHGHTWWLIGIVVGAALTLVAILEALPRALVARNPERWGIRLSPFMGAFKFLFGGAAKILDLPARALARQDTVGQEEEDLMRLLELEENEGDLEEDERKMIRGVFGLEGKSVREIMTPRLDIIAVNTESSADDVLKLVIAHGFSRIPLYETTADKIVGIVYAKDLIKYLAEGTMPTRLTEVARPPLFIPESKRLDDLLTDLRRRRVHMAIIIDEYGGTAGLVTIEDLIEEIVGEIEDEYDAADQRIMVLSDKEAIVDGRVGIDELNDLFHATIDDDDFDTVGGCVTHLLGRMPSPDDIAESDGLRFQVLAIDGHRVQRVRISVLEPDPAEMEATNGNGNGHKNGNAKNHITTQGDNGN